MGRAIAGDLPLVRLQRQAGTTVGAVLRRLFRFVVKVGAVAAATAGIAQLVGRRRRPALAPATGAGPLPRQAWPPLQPDPSAHEPAHDTALLPDPEAPAAPAAAPEPEPAPTDAGPDPIAESDVAWVEPDGEVCPTTHPVKAKLASKIFHVPGGLSYERTRPDRCYRDEAAAEADGLRRAKR